MREPLLQCLHRYANGTGCNRRYGERQAHRATHGRYKGRLVGPPGCCHPLSAAVYVAPDTGRILVPYAPAELACGR